MNMAEITTEQYNKLFNGIETLLTQGGEMKNELKHQREKQDEMQIAIQHNAESIHGNGKDGINQNIALLFQALKNEVDNRKEADHNLEISRQKDRKDFDKLNAKLWGLLLIVMVEGLGIIVAIKTMAP